VPGSFPPAAAARPCRLSDQLARCIAHRHCPQRDLNSISSDASNNPDNLALDGSQLEGDAQAALDDNAAQASQEIGAANSALASFNAANGTKRDQSL
jgi:hypothetical protein